MPARPAGRRLRAVTDHEAERANGVGQSPALDALALAAAACEQQSAASDDPDVARFLHVRACDIRLEAFRLNAPGCA